LTIFTRFQRADQGHGTILLHAVLRAIQAKKTEMVLLGYKTNSELIFLSLYIGALSIYQQQGFLDVRKAATRRLLPV